MTPRIAANNIGADNQATLKPEARSAVISPSADIRPNTNKIPVNMPIGNAYDTTNGTNNPTKRKEVSQANCPDNMSGKRSFSALPIMSTKANKPTAAAHVRTTFAKICR